MSKNNLVYRCECGCEYVNAQDAAMCGENFALVESMAKIFWKNNEPILLCSKSDEDNEWQVINGAWTLIMTSELQGYCKGWPETKFNFDRITDVPESVTGDYNEILNSARDLNERRT